MYLTQYFINIHTIRINSAGLKSRWAPIHYRTTQPIHNTHASNSVNLIFVSGEQAATGRPIRSTEDNSTQLVICINYDLRIPLRQRWFKNADIHKFELQKLIGLRFRWILNDSKKKWRRKNIANLQILISRVFFLTRWHFEHTIHQILLCPCGLCHTICTFIWNLLSPPQNTIYDRFACKPISILQFSTKCVQDIKILIKLFPILRSTKNATKWASAHK